MVPDLVGDDPLLGQELAGKYRVLSRLGAGGFGTVYSALNLALGIEVAIKVSRGPEDDARALREAQAAARLRSPYTVRVYDVGRLAGGALFIVMELLPGGPLRAWLAAHGPLSVPLAARWLGQVCAALHEAHAQGLVHRDLKPSNLFVVEGPNLETHLKLLDFGLVKSLAAPPGDLTQSGALLGSPRYMSPEQVRGVDITHESDIWALGVVLYECLSGRLPFERNSPHATLVAIASEPPRPLSEVAPGLPEEVHRLVGRCLRKAPRERFPSVRSLAIALAALVPSSSSDGSTAELGWLAADTEDRDPERERPPDTGTSQVTHGDRHLDSGSSAPASAVRAGGHEGYGRATPLLLFGVLLTLLAVWVGWRLSQPTAEAVPVLDHVVSAAPREPPVEVANVRGDSPKALVPPEPPEPVVLRPHDTKPSALSSTALARGAAPARSQAARTAPPTAASASAAPRSRLALDPDF